MIWVKSSLHSPSVLFHFYCSCFLLVLFILFCCFHFVLFCPTLVQFLLLPHYFYTFTAVCIGYKYSLRIHVVQLQTLYSSGSLMAIDWSHRLQNLCSKTEHSTLLQYQALCRLGPLGTANSSLKGLESLSSSNDSAQLSNSILQHNGYSISDL